MRNPDMLSQTNDVHYVDVLVREQEHLVGYAVIKIQSKITTVGGKAYFANVIKNTFYPKTNDGQYQTVSENYVREKIQEIKDKK